MIDTPVRRIAAFLFPLLLVLTAGMAAAQQTTTTPTEPPAATATMAIDADSHETREELRSVLQRYPPHVSRVLKLDPTLFGNSAWLAPYPALAKFVADHPDVPRSPQFYLEGISVPTDLPPDGASVRIWRQAMEGVSIFTVMLLFLGTFTWLVRTVIDHRRWSRVSKVQAEVHGKLMDRFSANEDLLAYIQTPAGKKFLESAPISLDGPRAISAPIGRVLWSVQAGLVLLSLGFGLQWVSRTIDKEVAGPVSAMGVLGVAIGLGFVASAIVSFILARRLGLWEPPPAAGTTLAD